MFKNYFKIALRNLLKNKITGFINLIGLSIGITAAVFIFLWVKSEMTYDDYHPGKENIYRITNAIDVGDKEKWIWESSPMLMGEFAKKEIPEVQDVVRLVSNSWGGPALNIGNKLFSEKTSAYIDKNWFDIFKYDFVAGSAAAFATNPFSVILTEDKAKKYFGNENPVGQVIRVDTVNYTVQAVIKNNPVNSSFHFDILYNLDGYLSDPKIYKNGKSWNNYSYITFLKLHPKASKSIVTSKLNQIINRQRSNHNDVISLQPLTAMYFETGIQNPELPHGNKKTAYIFSILAIMLLITACINYVNLTTARASLRAKEVGVRKIVGAKRVHLFFQFIAESLLISFFSLIVTLILIQACLPVFNTITEKQFELLLSSVNMWQVLLGTILFASILNSIYPAILLSSFNPLNVFRGTNILKLRDGTVRKTLVVFQFGLSIVLIIGTIIIFRQLKYIQTNDAGYNVSQVISLQIPYRAYAGISKDTKEQFFSSLKTELQSQTNITAVSLGNDDIVNVESFSSGAADWDGHDTSYAPTIAKLAVDPEFQDMFGLKLREGNWFKKDKEDERNYVINETAERMLNMKKPVVGQRFTWGEDTGKIIAVVKDFHFKSLHEKIGPMVLMNNKGIASHLFIRTFAGKTPQALAGIEKTWNAFMPTEPFQFTFMDESFDRLYKSDIKTSRLIFIFSFIAIIIAALGLFGLAAFTAEQRTKEIGIRKVLGASVNALVLLLSKDFIKLVLIALLIASPIAWYLMSKWLEDFAYRVDISWWVFAMAAFFAIGIAVITVSSQAIKAALANPVKNLRSE